MIQIFSFFYGPILAAFLAGVLSKRATGAGVIAGVLLGVAFNMVLWIGFTEEIFWMWWNLTGLIVAVSVTLLVSLVTRRPDPGVLQKFTLHGTGALREEGRHLKTYAVLAAYFVLILVVTFLI